jgi:hypothetical protein
MQQLSKKQHLDEKRESLVERRKRLLKHFTEAAEKGRSRHMKSLCRSIQQMNEFLDTLEKIKSETKPIPDPSIRRYSVSSLFLHECFKHLTADRDEQFVFITGPEMDGVLVLDQRIEFQHQKRNLVGVEGNTLSTHRLLIKLEQFGHRFLAHFHSHPGNGLESTHPSGTDEGYQRRLESAGYPTVAAIFSRDGYIRFFRLDNNCEVKIHGKGVQSLGNHIYKLTQLD